MTKMKSGLTVLMFLIGIELSSAQEKATISARDFKALIGSWQGSLTYLDYQSGKPYTMPADLEVKRFKKNQLMLFNRYPNEASANSSDTLTISSDGKFINTESVKSKRKLENGDVEIITEESGKDGNDNKSATFRHTYTISKTSFTKRKDVQFEGETNWINRHVYSYTIRPSSAGARVSL